MHPGLSFTAQPGMFSKNQELGCQRSAAETGGINVQNASRKLVRRYRVVGLAFLLPAIAFYLIFMTYPLMQTVYTSLTNWGGFGPKKFIGISNYIKAFSDTVMRKALFNTCFLAIASSIFSVLIGVLMAWVNMSFHRRNGQVTRTILFAPNMISPTIAGLMFLFVFTEDLGLLNNALRLIGLESLETAWLSNMKTVLWVIVIVTVWRQVGLPLVLCYAGFQGIPSSLIESARLDGAGDGQVFTKVLLPLIQPQIQMSVMFTLLGSLKIYDSVVSLTGGGPARQTVVMPMWIVENAFTYSKFGYASAMAVLFVLVVFVFMVIIKRIFRGVAYEF